MDGRFQSNNRTPGGGGSSENISSSASVASAASSVSSLESSPALVSSLRGSEAFASPTAAAQPTSTNTMDSSGSVTGEPHSPSVASIDASTAASNENSTPPPPPPPPPVELEPINPFEQTGEQSISSASSHQGETTPAQASLKDGPHTPLSPDRSVVNLPSNPPSPLQTIVTHPPSSTSSLQINTNASLSQRSNTAMHTNFGMEDDDTEPSSAVTSRDPGDPGSSTDGQDTATLDSDPAAQRSSISRFIESTRRRIGNTRKDMDGDDPAEPVPDVEDGLLGEEAVSGTLICGYLQKLGRNGKWQTRWFETDGECLSYYKSEKRTKLLATLDLMKVGSIAIDPEDGEGVSFNIQVQGRLYHLRADNKASCKDWVITLNRVKEARMQQGNVKLVSMPFTQPVDLLDTTPAQGDDFVAPRVVVLANRQRTRAVEEGQELNQLIQLEENNDGARGDGNFKSEKRRSALGNVVLARWTKRRSSLSRLRSKFAKWARSLRRLSCTSDAAIGLDTHVHPPGHDDQRNSKHDENPAASTPTTTGKKKKDGLSTWIGKEASLSSRSPPTPGALAPGVVVPVPAEPSRPRKNSTASEQDVRVLS